MTRDLLIWPLPDSDEGEMPPRPQVRWASFTTRGPLRGEFDPCGTGPVGASASSDETGAGT